MPRISGNKFVVELGKLLQLRRETLGMTREELAEKAGIRYDVIQMYEEGQRTMKIDRLFEILNALDISAPDCLTAIFGGTGTHSLNLVAKINTLSEGSCQRLLRQIDALIEAEKAYQF